MAAHPARSGGRSRTRRAGGGGASSLIRWVWSCSWRDSSDEAAALALAERRGRDLAADGVWVCDGGRRTSAAPTTLGSTPSRSCGDAREAAMVARAMEAAEVRSLGCFVCDADPRTSCSAPLAPTPSSASSARKGARAFRTFEKQPGQHGARRRGAAASLHRDEGRPQDRYGRLLVDALDLAEVPAPLDGLLAPSASPTGVRQTTRTCTGAHDLALLDRTRALATPRRRRVRGGRRRAATAPRPGPPPVFVASARSGSVGSTALRTYSRSCRSSSRWRHDEPSRRGRPGWPGGGGRTPAGGTMPGGSPRPPGPGR